MIVSKPSKNGKNIMYALILVSGLLLAGCENKTETPKKTIQKSLSAAEKKAIIKKWKTTPDGILYKKWEASAAGKKVFAAETKIRNHVANFTNIEAVVTALSLPPGSRLGFGVMVRINGDDYILAFGPEKPGSNEFEQLYKLKVNDKINIKSHSVSHAPKYSYPIVAGDYVELDGKIIYKRAPRKNRC